MYSIFDAEIGLNKWLQKGSDDLPGISQGSGDFSSLTNLNGGVISGGGENGAVGALNPNTVSSGEMGSILAFKKKNFSDVSEGWIQGLDTDNIYKWLIGGSTSSIDWSVTSPSTLTVKGTVIADTGYIGGTTSGWVITSGKLYGGSGSAFSGMIQGTGTTKSFFAGASDSSGTGAKFYVTAAGDLVATSATIAGYRLFEAVVDAAGNGDYTTIADALSAGKTRIFVRAGTYNISATISITSSDVRISGENRDTTIIFLNNSSNISMLTISTSKNNILIENITFDGNFANQSSFSYGIICAGFSGTGTTNSIFRNNYFKNCYSGGIKLGASSYNLIENNKFENSTSGTADTASVFLRGSGHNRIFNNIFSDTNTNANAIAIAYSGSQSNIVTSNYISGSYANGILSASSTLENTITNNVIKGVASGITIYADNNIITSNAIFSTSGIGIQLQNSGTEKNIVSSNQIVDAGTYGIYVNGTYNVLNNNSITDCANNGIQFVTNTANRNICDGNSVVGNSATGIKLEAGATSNIISNNVVYNNTTAQINDLGTTTVLDNNVVA